MINIEDKSKCSGCHACYNACPKNCITMKSDNEGFWYPSVDEKSCVDCGLCEKVCPILKVYKGYEKGKAYACVNKNSELRQKSSSTGVFSILAENVLDAGGVVFGAGFDENLKVRHISIKNKEDIRKIRGSKYVQSKIGDTYSEAKEYLQKGIKVLFAGTPCQISGLKSYLGKDYDNLILMDIICHGVPSPKVWKKYLYYIEKSNRKNIDKNNYPNFRSKRLGWGNFSMDINFTDGSVYTCLLYTSGSEKLNSELIEKAKKLNIEDKLLFLTKRDDVPQLLQAMDVFVFPSKHEGLGLVLIEAQASGLPCVVSDGVPKEVKAIDYVEFLSLNKDIQVWANEAVNLAEKDNRKSDVEKQLTDAGYNIYENANILRRIYMGESI